MGFRVLGFRVLGFRVLGFRVLGFRVLGFRGGSCFGLPQKNRLGACWLQASKQRVMRGLHGLSKGFQ